MTNTTRFGISKPASSDLVSSTATFLGTVADGFDAIVTGYSSGVFASRPAAGTAGRIYRATDVTTGGAHGTLYFDNGSTWDQLATSPITTGQITAGAVTTTEIANGTIATSDLADANVTKAKLATDALNAFLKLDAAVDRKLAFGTTNPGVGFVGGARLTWTFNHGLPSTPVWAIVGDTIVGSPDTSTGQTEVVAQGVIGLSSSQITVRAYLTGGATAAVGPGTTFWAAIY